MLSYVIWYNAIYLEACYHFFCYYLTKFNLYTSFEVTGVQHSLIHL